MLSPSANAIDIVVFPSPSGVGLIAVTKINSDLTVELTAETAVAFSYVFSSSFQMALERLGGIQFF